MTRLTLVDPSQATGEVAEMLDEYLQCAGVEPGPMVRGRAVNLTDADIALVRQGTAPDPRVAAPVAFAQPVTGAAGIHAAKPAAAQAVAA